MSEAAMLSIWDSVSVEISVDVRPPDALRLR